MHKAHTTTLKVRSSQLLMIIMYVRLFVKGSDGNSEENIHREMR